MFGRKNFTPKQLSAFTAIVLSIPVACSFLIYSHSWVIFSIAFVVMFLFSYLLIGQVLERFIYRKIKLIYKFIYQTKASKKEEMYYKYILPQKGIDEVRKDVEQWATQRNSEIATLRNNEAFRREFLQNFSHEIKTPVFAIQGYTEMLMDEDGLEDTTQTLNYLEKIYRNIDRMVTLVNDVDEIARLETGKIQINKQGFIIQNLIEESFESVQIQALAKNIHLSIKKGCEVPISVVADEDKIRQVVVNILVNAIKYGHDNGSVVASVYKTEGHHVLVEFSDNGIGIAEEHLSRVFERFYRTDNSRSRNIGGSGLGLAICKHIIEAHNETIHIRSKLGVGTTIGFTLGTNK